MSKLENTKPVGIMQGRLVPPEGERFQCFPRDGWRNEFAFAAEAGLSAIEWIFDVYGMDVNPLTTDEGLVEIQALSRTYGIAVDSVCADYFMDRMLVRATTSERAEGPRMLEWLLGRCQACGIRRMVLPFVDSSKIETEIDCENVISTLEQILPVVEQTGVGIHLETSLAPADFRRLLDRIPHRMILANYDSGNSASLGYDPLEEWDTYGQRIGSVHIKDRLRGAGTVPLGTGDTDFPALFRALRAARYDGPFVLQVARGTSGEEVSWARGNRAFLLNGLSGTGTR